MVLADSLVKPLPHVFYFKHLPNLGACSGTVDKLVS